MAIRLSTLGSMLFFVLFPIMHLNGYYGARGNFHMRGISLLFVVFSVLFFLKEISKKNNIKRWYYLGLFAWLAIISGVVVLLSGNKIDSFGRSAIFFNVGVLVRYVFCISLGLSLRHEYKNRYLILMFWLAMVVNVLTHIDYMHLRMSFEGFDASKVGVYLMLGDTFAIWSIFTLSIFKDRLILIAPLWIVSLVCLFLFNSRTSLYAFIIASCSCWFLLGLKKKIFCLVFGLLVLAFFVGTVDIKYIENVNSRMFAIKDLGSDSSYSARQYLEEQGIRGLANNWFFGDYSGQLRYGSLGSYIHNYLSLWRQFGFPVFLSFILLCIPLVKFIISNLSIMGSNLSNMNMFLFYGGVFSLVEVLFARSYVTPYIWLFIGLNISRLTERDEERVTA